MVGFLRKLRDFITIPTGSRTIALLVILAIAAAVSLTVIVAQQQQQLKQQAADSGCLTIYNSVKTLCDNAYNQCVSNCQRQGVESNYNECLASTCDQNKSQCQFNAEKQYENCLSVIATITPEPCAGKQIGEACVTSNGISGNCDQYGSCLRTPITPEPCAGKAVNASCVISDGIVGTCDRYGSCLAPTPTPTTAPTQNPTNPCAGALSCGECIQLNNNSNSDKCAWVTDVKIYSGKPYCAHTNGPMDSYHWCTLAGYDDVRINRDCGTNICLSQSALAPTVPPTATITPIQGTFNCAPTLGRGVFACSIGINIDGSPQCPAGYVQFNPGIPTTCGANQACCQALPATANTPTPIPVNNVTLALTLNAQDVPTTESNLSANLSLYNLSTNSPVAGAPAAQVFTKTPIPGKQYSANISLSNLQKNRYFIVAQKDNMIAKSVFTVSGPNERIAVPTTTLVFGDINNDKDINILDYNALKDCWTQSAVSSVSCETADFDTNNIIDQLDYNTWLRGSATWNKPED